MWPQVVVICNGKHIVLCRLLPRGSFWSFLFVSRDSLFVDSLCFFFCYSWKPRRNNFLIIARGDLHKFCLSYSVWWKVNSWTSAKGIGKKRLVKLRLIKWLQSHALKNNIVITLNVKNYSTWARHAFENLEFGLYSKCICWSTLYGNQS